MQSLNFYKVKKIDNQCEMGPPLREKMTEIISSNLASLISKTTSYSLVIALCQSHCQYHWRIMSSNQRKGDPKLAALQKSLVKILAGVLIFAEV